MSVNWDIAQEVADIIVANAADDAFNLPISPILAARVDVNIPPIGQRLCYVLPAGVKGERANRGNDRIRTYYVNIVLIEAIPGNPMSDAGRDFLRQRATLIEEVEALDFSEVSSASWEESNIRNLLDDLPTADEDSVWMQVVELEFTL